MTPERILTAGTFDALTDDVREHGYAIVQTRVERVPARYRAPHCTDIDGCRLPATLVTVAVAEVTEDHDGAVGLSFARRNGSLLGISVCDEHRVEASHDLFYALTERERPDGIRAFDLPGQYLHWT